MPERATRSAGPDFLGIGAMRSGSTWLHRNLRAHPGLWLPPIKELHYFDCQARAPRLNKFSRAHLRRRLRAYGHAQGWSPASLRWDAHYFLRRRSDAWYRGLFQPLPGQMAGEITPRYSILDTDEIARIRALLPELRLVFVMRNPLERSWSQVTKGALDELGPAALELPIAVWERRLDSEGVRRRSDYPGILRRWSSHFAADRFFVAFFEEIDASPVELLKRVFAFLGVGCPDAAWFRAERIGARINPSPASGIPMPAPIRRLLAVEHRSTLEELHERFGGHASRWLREAERALAVPESRSVRRRPTRGTRAPAA